MLTKIKHSTIPKKLILILPIFLIQFGCKQNEESQTKVKEEQTMQSLEAPEEKISTNNTTNGENANQSEELSSDKKEELSSDKKIVATVNGRPIYKENLRGRNVEYAVFEEILYEDALIKGLDKQYEKQIEKYKKALITHGILREIRSTLPKEDPTD